MTQAATAGAELSACGRYRLLLWRRWGDGGVLAAVLLNPSTADADRDDPTLRAVTARARAAGLGAVRVANLFTLRSADPQALRAAEDPVGPGADAAIDRAVEGAALVLCGWGAGGALAGRGAAVAARLAAADLPLVHLGLTRGGQPRHPLYVPQAVPMRDWRIGG